MERVTLHLAKENFKFAAAHFLIFDQQRAEKLHGHNYYVSCDITVGITTENKAGFFKDFRYFKDIIKSKLEPLDECVLFPALHPEMKHHVEGTSVTVLFRERRYMFPSNEVVWLPVKNTSVEELSRYLCTQLSEAFKNEAVFSVTVTIEESRGQSASSTSSRS